MKNHYQTLGIKNNANQNEIKKAYRKLAIKFHPDKNVGDNFFDELFKEIKNAYEILSNPISKRNYDLKYNNFINNRNSSNNKNFYENEVNKKPNTSSQKKHSKLNEFTHSYKLPLSVILVLILITAFLVNGVLGLITLLGLYLSFYLFINSLKTKKFGLKSFLSIIIFVLLSINTLEFIKNNNRKQVKNIPIKKPTVTRTEKEKISPNKKSKESEELKMDDYLRNMKENLKKNDEFLKKINSKYYGNQLKNGTSPLNACFGKGLYSQNAWLRFKNSNKTDAIVCLVRSYDQKTIRNEYIKAGSNFEMSKIPSGLYYIKVYYGNDWNPNKKNFCGINGAFENNVRFSKSDKIGDQIRIENTNTSYTTGTITLYAVEDGNMSTERINEEDFFEK